MSYYIIIRGPLGVGKSKISLELAEKLKAEYISMDKLLEKLNLDKVDKDEGCVSAKNFIKADEFILPRITEDLSNGKVVIIDGCFYQKEQLTHLINNLPGFKHYVFSLKASLQTCIDRDKGRKWVRGEGSATAIHNLVSRFDSGEIIDTENKTVEQEVDEIISYIK